MLLLNFFLILILLNFTVTTAKNDFCIEDYYTNENIDNLECNIMAKLVTENEKEILEKMCNTRPNFFNDTRILVLKNGTFQLFNQLKCDSNLKNIELVWLPYDKMNINLTNLSTHYEVIAKSTNDTLSSTTICPFNMKHKNCGIEFQNGSSIIISHFNLLSQLLPLELTISNINYKPWKNITSSGYPIPMSGKIYLPNHQPTYQKLFDTIKYSYFEKISVNLSKIIATSIENNLEISKKINYNGNLLNIENDGNAYAHKSKEFTFSRVLPPLNAENATLIGEWSTYIVEFSADIKYNYGNKHIGVTSIDNIKMVVKTITDIDIDFGGPVPLNHSTSMLNGTQYKFQYNESKIKENKIGHNGVEETATLFNKNKIQINQQSSPGYVYPNFYPWFVGSCIIIAITCCIVFGNMISIIIKEKQIKRKRYRTGSLM